MQVTRHHQSRLTCRISVEREAKRLHSGITLKKSKVGWNSLLDDEFPGDWSVLLCRVSARLGSTRRWSWQERRTSEFVLWAGSGLWVSIVAFPYETTTIFRIFFGDWWAALDYENAREYESEKDLVQYLIFTSKQATNIWCAELPKALAGSSLVLYVPRTQENFIIAMCSLTRSFAEVINFKFLLQPHQKHYIAHYEELGSSSLPYSDKRWLYYNSHYITYAFSL